MTRAAVSRVKLWLELFHYCRGPFFPVPLRHRVQRLIVRFDDRVRRDQVILRRKDEPRVLRTQPGIYILPRFGE